MAWRAGHKHPKGSGSAATPPGNRPPAILSTIRDGEIFDAGYRHYREIIVTSAFGRVLLNGGMRKVNGKRVHLHVKDRNEACGTVTLEVRDK